MFIGTSSYRYLTYNLFALQEKKRSEFSTLSTPVATEAIIFTGELNKKSLEDAEATRFSTWLPAGDSTSGVLPVGSEVSDLNGVVTFLRCLDVTENGESCLDGVLRPYRFASSLVKFIMKQEGINVTIKLEQAFDVIAQNYGEMSLFDLKSAVVRICRKDIDLADLPADVEEMFRKMDMRGTGLVTKQDWLQVSCAYVPHTEAGLDRPEPDVSALDLSIDHSDNAHHHDVMDWGSIELYRGETPDVDCDVNTRTVQFVGFDRFDTMKSAARCGRGQRGYYEIEILDMVENPQFGFASEDFERRENPHNDGQVDDDPFWAVDGERQKKWHPGPKHKIDYACKWKTGDVIGLACDLVKQQILVSVNGSYETPNGVVFELAESVGELFAAFTAKRGKIRYNFGGASFKFKPPWPDTIDAKDLALFRDHGQDKLGPGLRCDHGHNDLEQMHQGSGVSCDKCSERNLKKSCWILPSSVKKCLFWCRSCKSTMCGRWISTEDHDNGFNRSGQDRRSRTLQILSVALLVNCCSDKLQAKVQSLQFQSI